MTDSPNMPPYHRGKGSRKTDAPPKAEQHAATGDKMNRQWRQSSPPLAINFTATEDESLHRQGQQGNNAWKDYNTTERRAKVFPNILHQGNKRTNMSFVLNTTFLNFMK